MMMPFLILLAAPQAPERQLVTLPRLTTGCVPGRCPMTARPSPYRLGPDRTSAIDSKSRAFANDGTYCAVVGDKYCTSKPRTLFRMPIDQ
ncbi:hypothetical protein QE385_002655 [Sphingomonas sp. SORGH_AS 950]|uniref:hypothetical protein n=1 Tax=unclassified Sphingomonas TaxID=196159 RepID=UPI002788460C|nr:MULTISPECIES: hypothetical protein [unclassified Sphingomonas]MDQ1158328.1 hypothetical protein [Sphingomonas sp. SORGH_AS_0950]MDR6145100.1 hypothetical protein [Sphingomonas sp. SORGH_AS_0870]